jgi:hypothetical protein
MKNKITVGTLLGLIEGYPPNKYGLDCAEVIPELAEFVLDYILDGLTIGDMLALEKRLKDE